ncbi:MAG TPA: GWxTD domain-containing protein [Gemmatimonadaceae bacterium]|nr:GWxTD domain-containing protein [Gemmatimonadaceae bacterium]
MDMRRLLFSQVVFTVLVAGAAFAQAPEGSNKLTPAAVADSLAVLKQLDSALRAHPRDAATWYRRGMVAWALSERDRAQPPIPGLDWTLLGHMADTSLRIAADIDANNGQYRMMAGRYLLGSGVSITRAASYGLFANALERARKNPDPHVHAETAVEVGRLHWRRYEDYAYRFIFGDCPFAGAGTADLRGSIANPDSRNVRDAVRRDIQICKQWILNDNTEYMGEADYLEAEAYFREAFEAQPTFERAYRQLAMLLVDRYRWRELEIVARTRINAVPWDAWAWLTLGLSVHRQRGDVHLVTAAFDSGFRLLKPEDARRLDHLERVLRPRDTLRTLALDSVTHRLGEEGYWKGADPLWAREGNEPRTEFLARVTYAELRWTAEEMNVHGADTDRGDVHIRYGPPDLIVTTKQPLDPFYVITWVYEVGLVFRFDAMLTFATAFLPADDQLSYGEIQGIGPARWDNIREFDIDSMPSQFARFRAAADSVDLFIAARAPVAKINDGADLAGGVRADFWVLANGITTIVHDTSKLVGEGTRTYQKRIPAGAYTYRVEASAEGGHVAARAAAVVRAMIDTVTGFATRGFGMSDVVLASTATSRGPVRRWNDLDLQPILGTAIRKGTIALVWENYELGNTGGAAKYLVAVTVEKQRSLAGKIAAQVIGRVGSAVGVDRQGDRVTSHFERNLAYAPVLVDNVDLALGDTPPGTYKVTVAVSDHVTGRTTSRTMILTITDK